MRLTLFCVFGLFLFNNLQSQTNIVLNVSQNSSLIVDAGADYKSEINEEIGIGDLLTVQGGSGNYFYDWESDINIDNPNDENPVTTLSETTTFKVTVTDDLGCSASDEITITIQPLSADNIEENDNISQIFPNPSSGNFILKLDGTKIQGKIELVVLNVEGKRVLHKQVFVDSDNCEIPFTLDNFKKDIYFLQIKSAQTRHSQSFILK